MIGRFAPGIVLVLAMVASPTLAETYKWVDAKGVVTYSDTPPTSAVAKPKVVEERISVIPPDPTMGPAVAAMLARAERRAKDEEADYARRQQYMMQAQASYAATACPYGTICDAGYDTPAYYPYSYGYGYGYGGRGYGAARRHGPQVTPYRASFRPGPGAGGMHAAGMVRSGGGRGSFR